MAQAPVERLVDSTSMEDVVEVLNSDRLPVLSNTGSPLTAEDHLHFQNHQHRSLCFRHIPFHFRDRDLRHLVAKVLNIHVDDSSIEICRVKYNRHDGVGKPMQVGYVMLQTPELAQTVVRRLEETPRHSGRDIRYTAPTLCCIDQPLIFVMGVDSVVESFRSVSMSTWRAVKMAPCSSSSSPSPWRFVHLHRLLFAAVFVGLPPIV